jgi:RND family efflux transporter MFP subunit
MYENAAGRAPSGRKWWLIPALLLLLAVTGAGAFLAKGSSPAPGRGAEEAKKTEESSTGLLHVDVIRPIRDTLARKTSQAGTAWALEWADIYAEVSGYLKERNVDIGSVVNEGDVLARIDVPDLEARMEEQSAAVGLAEAQMNQKNAAIDRAKADLKASEAKYNAAIAKRKSDEAYLAFRDKQLDRYQRLLTARSIDAKLVDEQEDHREAAFQSVNASIEAVAAAAAQKESAKAHIEEAEAEFEVAKQTVGVAKAELKRAEVMVKFATIRARFSGVISYRDQGFNPGAFIRAANGGSASGPLLTLQHNEIMRIVVPIPDRDMPYCKPGVSTAHITFDALPKEEFPPYKVSRIAQSEDPQTKTMRAEIDVPNPKGLIAQGMYGLVTITLAKAENTLSIPSACLVGKRADGEASVYVDRDGKVYSVKIKTGLDNGIDVEVIEGIGENDRVVLNPSDDLAEGIEVTTTEIAAPKASAARH